MVKSKLESIKPKTMDMPEVETKHFPSLNLSSTDLKEIEDWEVGEDYFLTMKVSLVNKEESESEDGEKCNARFEIKKISSIKGEKEDETKKKIMSKYE